MEEGYNEIDFKALGLRLWAKRMFILKILGGFTAVGLLVAIFQAPVFVAKCTFVPQTSSKSNSSLSSLAMMAGINLNDMNTGQTLSPLIYPQMLHNTELQKELIRVPLHMKKYDEPVSLYDKMTDPKYRKFDFLATLKKYTIGLPRTILGLLRGKPDEVSIPNTEGRKSPISSLSYAEYKCIKATSTLVSMDVDKKDGYLTLTARMNEPVAAAELCQGAFDLMQKYVTDFKLQNARKNQEYIQGRQQEAMADFEQKQLALARFTDANRGILTATAQIEKDKLMSDYQLSYTLFTEISKQLLQADMKVKEDSPILSSVEPVCIPMMRSNSRSKTLFIWVFLGILVSCGSVLGIDWLRKQGLKWPKNWE